VFEFYFVIADLFKLRKNEQNIDSNCKEYVTALEIIEFPTNFRLEFDVLYERKILAIQIS
jgi:hypothetical protein